MANALNVPGPFMNGLSPLLAPRSVAIVGISADATKHGARVLTNINKLGFPGEVWGVNPKVPQMAAVEVFPDMAALPRVPDLVVCAIPALAVPGVVRDAAMTGAQAAIVFAGGFAETGAAGRSAQSEITEIVRSTGIRVLGPNSGGIIHPSHRLAASFLTCLDRPARQIRSGPVGLVTQSGGTGSYIHNLAAANGDGLAVSVSTGNEADIDVADAILALCDHDEVQAIALVIETVRDGEAFTQAVQHAHGLGKPIIACRIGASEQGRGLMRSHTGAIASAPRVLDGVLDALSVTRVETPGELLDVANIMARSRAPVGNRVGVVTHSGGVAILLSDLGEQVGVRLPPPSKSLRGQLRPLLDLGTADNPLDMGGIMGGPQRFREVVDLFARSGDYDSVLAVSTAHPPIHTASRVEGLLELDSLVPVVHLWMAGDQGSAGLRSLTEAGHPVTEEPRAAMRALAGLGRLADVDVGSLRVEHRGGESEPGGDFRTLSEHEAKELLASWRLSVVEGVLARTAEDAAEAAESLGGVLAVKVSSPDIAHKTEVGGVLLGVSGRAAASDAFHVVTEAARKAQPTACIDGARVERQQFGLEIIAGVLLDPTFGVIVMLGMGGVAAEALGGNVFAPGPVSRDSAMRMIDRVPGLRRTLTRQDPEPEATNSLAELMVTASERFVDAELQELEMNPLTWTGREWQILDALVSESRRPGQPRSSTALPDVDRAVVFDTAQNRLEHFRDG